MEKELTRLKTSRHPTRSHKPAKKVPHDLLATHHHLIPAHLSWHSLRIFSFRFFFESVKSHSLPFLIRISQHSATGFNSFSPWSRPPTRCRTNQNDEHPLTIFSRIITPKWCRTFPNWLTHMTYVYTQNELCCYALNDWTHSNTPKRCRTIPNVLTIIHIAK